MSPYRLQFLSVFLSYQGSDLLFKPYIEGELELAVDKLFLSDSNFFKMVVGLVDKFDSMDETM